MDAKEMILRDAIEWAIRSERDAIILRKWLYVMSALCGVLLFITGCLLWTVI